MGTVAENFREVLAKVQAAAARAGRSPSDIRLVAVTKTVGPEAVLEAVRAGALYLGENRVQEAISKMRELADVAAAAEWRAALTAISGWHTAVCGLGASSGVEWHLIGTLQKNKARHAVGAFALIHSVDSLELAREIDRQAAKRGLVQDVLIEVNVAGESTKHGIKPDAVLPIAKEVALLPNVRLAGLMCVPPFTDNAEDSRPHFIAMRELLAEINKADIQASELSMGMTQDYEVAVEEGATLVRVGTAIFGARIK